jgi:afadin
MAEEVAVSKFEYNDDDIDDVVNSVDTEEEQFDDNDNNLSQENLETSHEDPNAFISAAETLLSGQTLSKLEVSHVTTTHTPSVIGTQEVYRDPRSRRLAQEQERKISGPKQPDGAKLSFQEKMKLFAQEAGEKTPRDKAKISKAQREIDD